MRLTSLSHCSLFQTNSSRILIRAPIAFNAMSFRESDHVHEREKSPIPFLWIKRSELLYIYDVNECRGDFRIVTSIVDECLKELHGVFGFGSALEDVELTGKRPCGSTCLFEGW